jgi:hypothetical protein
MPRAAAAALAKVAGRGRPLLQPPGFGDADVTAE